MIENLKINWPAAQNFEIEFEPFPEMPWVPFPVFETEPFPLEIEDNFPYEQYFNNNN
tara:strand:+ start:29832 stop:30002 length:171 start_codon:yes stop_codon:yes gene_type:complete